VLFRGYMFGQLYRRGRWGFWLSALVPSALFALGHAYQASGFWELVGIFAITGLGSLLGCWIQGSRKNLLSTDRALTMQSARLATVESRPRNLRECV
jgi:membrane protease YdiL (CAAX protease family)